MFFPASEFHNLCQMKSDKKKVSVHDKLALQYIHDVTSAIRYLRQAAARPVSVLAVQVLIGGPELFRLTT